jgi:hypothetical protein
MIRLYSLTLLLVLAQGCGDPRQPSPDSTPDLPPQVDLSLDGQGPDAVPTVDADGAVDDAADGGIDLTPDGPVPDAPSPPTHAACAAAHAVTLDTSGVVTLTDTTAWSHSEFGSAVSCGDPAGPWSGPQNYYRIKLVKGATYKVTLRTGGFDGALYAFPATTACSAAAINAACKPATAGPPPIHLSSDNPGAGADELLRLAPTVSADWIVAVDSASPKAAGLFQLTLAQTTPPPHGACGKAQAVALSGGATVKLHGDTSDADNELGAAVTCGGGAARLGPQLYYKVTLAAGDKLGLTLKPSFPARAYVFPAASCAAVAINAGCGSSGNSGLALSAAAGASAATLFSPSAGGDFIVAVDSAAPWSGGPFSLELQAVTPPTNAGCVYAKDLTLDASGAVNVSGSTTGAADEFAALTCGGAALSGPQVYYKLKKLTGGVTYRLLLTPSFAAELYIFSTAAACKLAGIETDCQGAAAKGARMLGTTAPNTTRSLYFKPATSGDYFVAVDSLGAASAGTFSLAVARTSAPTNTSCKKAQSVTLTAGKAEVTGETHGSSDELPGLRCGGFTLLDGPQVYYSVALTAGQTYKLALAPTFSAWLYLYGPAAAKSCTEGALEQDCAGKGAGGLTLGPVATGHLGTALFTPAASGSYGLAVDSADASHAGYFGLNMQAYTAPNNGTCAAPAALALSASPTSVSGDTAGVQNEFGQAVTCGGAQSYDGPQLYYRLSLSKGTRYTLALSPAGWDAALYAFTDGSCQPASITSRCALLGLADAGGLSGQETLTLTPAQDGDVIVAVDGAAPAAGGPFALTVSWK